MEQVWIEPTPPPPEHPERPEGVAPRWPAWFAGIGFLVALIATLVVVGIVAAATGATTDDENATFTVVATFLQGLIFIGTAVLFASFAGKPRPEHFGLRRTPFWPTVGWAALGLPPSTRWPRSTRLSCSPTPSRPWLRISGRSR